MVIKTSQAINGFIASQPNLTHGDDGTPRFYARIGINHFERRQDGTFAELEPTFHDLIQFGKAAERSAALFAKGDQFIAQGRTDDFTREVANHTVADQRFIASRIGHDATITRYQVERGSRGSNRDSQERANLVRDEPASGGVGGVPSELGPSAPLSNSQAVPAHLINR